MKTLSATLAAICLASTFSVAQVVTEPGAQVVGTVSTFDPTARRIMVAPQPGAAPVAYSFTEKTTIVDETGAPVAVDVVRSGAPVTVYYAPVAGQMTVSKVVVRKAVPAAPVIQQEETTTTTTRTKSDD